MQMARLEAEEFGTDGCGCSGCTAWRANRLSGQLSDMSTGSKQPASRLVEGQAVRLLPTSSVGISDAFGSR